MTERGATAVCVCVGGGVPELWLWVPTAKSTLCGAHTWLVGWLAAGGALLMSCYAITHGHAGTAYNVRTKHV